MRLPALSVIIGIQAIIWCVAGSLPSVHGPRILLYPLAWGLIAAGFYLHAKTFPISEAGAESSAATEAAVQQPSAEKELATG